MNGWTKLRLKYFNAVSQTGNYRGTTDPASKRTCHAEHFVFPVDLSTLTQTTERTLYTHVKSRRQLQVTG